MIGGEEKNIGWVHFLTPIIYCALGAIVPKMVSM
jgi:hypothetical protein